MTRLKNLYTPLFLILLSSPLFFYKLGQSSLVSWDEAWYGSIAKNILKSGNFFNLTFNGKPYLDHPPVGFILQALSMKIFGVSEWSVDLPSVICGLLSILLIYLIGKKMFGRWVGIFSSLALLSAPWFLYRARSGNLDVPLTMFFLVTFYFCLRAKESGKFFILFILSLGLLILTKSVVPFTILPVLALMLWDSKIKASRLVLGLIFLLAILTCYVLSQISVDPHYLNRYLGIGLPGVGTKTDYLANLKQITAYLHSGIGKWYWPGLAGLIVGTLLFQKRLFFINLFIFLFMFPFVLSDRGQIWHLVPVFPFMILSFFGTIYAFVERFKSKLLFIPIGVVLLWSVNTIWIQTRHDFYQFVDVTKFVSDEAILSKESAHFSEPLKIDSDFIPAAVFYSEKVGVNQIYREALKPLLEGDERFVMITYDWRLKELETKNYRIIKQDRDKVLIIHPAQN